MEQFALIGMQNKGHRYIKDHPLLRLLPIKWAERIIPRTKARFTETIYTEDNQDELGYIIDVPGFFVNKDKLKDLDRSKVIRNLVDMLIKRNIRILVFPLWREFISIKEKEYLDQIPIFLLDGHLLRAISLMMVVERLFTILKMKPNEMEIGIWGADTGIGQVWAEFLAPYLNYLVIGGHNQRILEDLSNKIIYNTGLSCTVSKRIEHCTDNKTFAVLCRGIEQRVKPHNTRIIINSDQLSYGCLSFKDYNTGGIFIESGWLSSPQNQKVINALKPWDEMGAMEASLFIRDETYRNILVDNALNIENIGKVKKILERYDANCTGMISNSELLSYNGFRKLYFGNILDKTIDGIL